MELIADGLLIAGAMAAAFYCWVLSVRVKGLKDLDQGLGAAIAGLSTQVNDMRAALKNTQATAGASVENLRQTTQAAEAAAERLAGLLDNYADIQGAQVPRPAPSAEKPEPVPAPPKPDAKTAKQSPLARVAQKVVAKADPVSTAPTAREDTAEISAAQKLQEDIRERVTGRSNGGGQEDFVKALQSVLAAANK